MHIQQTFFFFWISTYTTEMYTSMVYTPSVSLFISWKIKILDSCLRFNKRYGEYRKLKKQEFILSEGGHVF